MEINTKRNSYYIPKDINIILPNELKKLESIAEKNYGINKKEANGIIKNLKCEISNFGIIKNVADLKHLILEITQSCNFRCLYCIYGGLYESERLHNPVRMKFEIAKKAVDNLYEQCCSRYRTTKDKIVIGFYGGEPLIEFELVKKIIKYVNQLNFNKFGEFRFLLTTNGFLLNPEIVDFLVKENVKLDISLDGPEKEHNKFRLTANGSGSWRKVIQNAIYIYKNYPQYYSVNVGYNTVIHPDHDLEIIEKYFYKYEELFNEDNVNPYNFKLDDINEKNYEILLKKYINQIRVRDKKLDKSGWFYQKLVYGVRSKFFNTLSRNKMSNFTGTCFPGGERLFVDPNGKYHICEKINENFPIGDVDQGFDIKAIKKIITDWRGNIIKNKCWECEVYYICTECYVQSQKNGILQFTENCEEEQKNRVINTFKNYLNHLEEEDAKENQINSCNTIDSFMELL